MGEGENRKVKNNNELKGIILMLVASLIWSFSTVMIKTAIENDQNLIVEGCYIPFDWQKDFSAAYLLHIRFLCLIFSKEYIEKNFSNIQAYANVIEMRIDDSGLEKEELIKENENNLRQCRLYDCPHILIHDGYDLDRILECI